MTTGALRILPFALVSTVLHAVVLVSAPERLDFAVTPAGAAGAVSVRLIPAGPSTPDPAARAGVAGSVPHAEPPGPTAGSQAEREAPTKTDPQSTKTASAAPVASQRAEPDRDTEPEPKPMRTREPHAAPDPAQQRGGTAKPQRNEPARATSHRTPEKPPSPERAPNRDAAGAASGAGGAARRAQLAQQARQEVTVRFRQEFHYPRIARQRGWEGRVVLAFRVHADGRITNVEVVESSGRAVLDEAARRSLENVERIPGLSDRMGGGSLDLEVPVTYRLQPA